MENRYPNSKVREILRKEVGFGCPVKNCGSPYLTYHHFDPPWNKCKEHNPDGMIALCLSHHKEADHGAFSIAQLYELKKSPFLLKEGLNPSGKFNWIRKSLVFQAGSNWFINPSIVITKGKLPILKIIGDSHAVAFVDFSIYNKTGILVFEMVKNEWIVTSEVTDLICPPSNKAITLSSVLEGFKFQLRFDSVSASQLLTKQYGSISRSILDNLLLHIEGFDLEDHYRKLTPDNFEQKSKELESLKETLDKNTILTTLTFSYRSDYSKINLTNKSINIEGNPQFGFGNLLIDSNLSFEI